MNYEELKILNQDWQNNYISNLHRDKTRILNQIIESQNEIKDYSAIDKFNFFVENIFELSLFRDNEVINVLNSCGIGCLVTDYFVNIDEVFDKLEEYYDKSIYQLPYTFILDYYEAYSKIFLINQLIVELGFDLNKELDKVRRQERDSNVDETMISEFDKLKEVNNISNDDNLDLRILISKKYTSTSIRKTYNKPHKILMYNLLITLRDNSMASPIQEKELDKFYASFYDLMELLSRDTEYLWDDTETRDVRSKYDSDISFKAKRVKSLLKLKGYGSYD